MDTSTRQSSSSVDLFLSSEERFEVYSVKAEERPHYLLPTTSTASEEYYDCSKNSNNDVTDTDDDNNSSLPLPLTDGCDIPRWRSRGLVHRSSQSLLQAALNVGIGCTLLRRERQLPLPQVSASSAVSQKQQEWKKLRDRLLQSPVTASVEVISCSEASQFLISDISSSDVLATSNEEKKVDSYYSPQSSLPPILDAATSYADAQYSTRLPRKHFSKWEQANVPVIISGCTQDWDLDAWTFESLLENYGNVRWRFSDTHGALLSLDTYAKYIQTEGLLDDAPLGVYDSEFGDADSPMHRLLSAYKVPPCFSDDLFALATFGEEEHDDSITEKGDNDSSSSEGTTASSKNTQRPPWRWILMGPPRSGTGLHIDPLWTNAWVTLLEGVKRWILIPPELTDQLPTGAGLQEPQVPSALWFQEYYDSVSQMEGVVEILQRPGDTVFVPNGWPHLVINLERTVAVTHNYASEFGPFERMWQQVAQEEPEFAQRWYRGLCQHRPDLASRIQMTVNHKDT